jgi:hypothetical protein
MLIGMYCANEREQARIIAMQAFGIKPVAHRYIYACDNCGLAFDARKRDYHANWDAKCPCGKVVWPADIEPLYQLNKET